MNVGEKSCSIQFSSWNGLVVTLKRSLSFALSVHCRVERISKP